MLENSSRIWEQVHELRIAGCYPAARIENLSFIKEIFYTRSFNKKTSTTKNHSIPTHVFTSTEKHGILIFVRSKPKKPIGAVGDTLDIRLSMRLLLYRTRRRTPPETGWETMSFRRPAKKMWSFETWKLPSWVNCQFQGKFQVANFLLRCMDSVFARLSWTKKKHVFATCFYSRICFPGYVVSSRSSWWQSSCFLAARRLAVEKRDQKLEQWAKQTRIGTLACR